MLPLSVSGDGGGGRLGSVAWEGSRASEGESGRAPLAQYGGSPLTIGSLGGYSPLGSDGERLSECVVVSISLSLSR